MQKRGEGKGEGFNKLAIRPIISNIGTATCETANFLNSFLGQLENSEGSILNTETIVN